MNEHENLQPGAIAAQPAITEVKRRPFILNAKAGRMAGDSAKQSVWTAPAHRRFGCIVERPGDLTPIGRRDSGDAVLKVRLEKQERLLSLRQEPDKQRDRYEI
jgi:hypothetical protein